MNSHNNAYTIFKTFLFVILVSFILSSMIFNEDTLLGYLAVLSLFFLIGEYIFSLVKIHKYQVFSLNTEYGTVKISERVIENIISIIIRKYKIIRHYICSVYNKDGKLYIVLNVETTLLKADFLPIILDTLKTNIKDSINETVCVIKADEVEIIIERIKKV